MIADRLLTKAEVEARTSLDASTLYRRIKRAEFPAPLQVGLRRVAWRERDVAEWQAGLTQGVRVGVTKPKRGRSASSSAA